MSDLFHDVRHGLRGLRRSPTATLVAVLTLGVGVGANTAIVSIMRSTLLEPLPYSDAARLVVLGERWPTLPGLRPISRMNYRDWIEQSTLFELTAADTWDEVTVGGGSAPVHVASARVSPAYFDVFGLRAELGRAFVTGDDQPGRDRVLVLSHRLWVSQFGADRSIVGRDVRLDDDVYTIIGVMAPGASTEFGTDLSDPQLWRPLTAEPPPPRGVHDLRLIVGKLRSGVTLAQARREMDTIAARLAADYPDTNKGYGVIVDPFTRPVGFHVASSLYLLFASAAVVLLLACVNLASIALARSTAKAREAAIRTALGASRAHLVREFLIEHLLIAAAGGLSGVAVAYGIVAMLKGTLALHGLHAAFPEDTRVSVDVSMWSFAFALAMLSGIVCGLVPALRVAGSTSLADLREGHGTAGMSRSSRHLQQALVAAQVALAFVLLTGAALLLQSLAALTRHIAKGFDAANVLTMKLPIPETRFASGIAFNAYLDQIASRVQSVPAIRAVAFGDSVPTEGIPYGKLFQIVGEPTVPYANRPICGFKVVSPSYFPTVGMRLVEGRLLSDPDRDGAPLVTVVNESMARTFFHGADPVGRRLLMRRNPIRGPAGTVDLDWTIVGVVADEGVSPFDSRAPTPAVYVTREQYPRLDLALVVKAAVNPTSVADAIRGTIATVDGTQAIADVKTIADLEAEDTSSDRLRSTLLSAFAGVALFLATLGLYGVIAFVVVQRTREIGIRAALGATTSALLGLVMRQGMTMIGAGLGAGVVVSVLAARLLKTLLFGIAPFDPLTIVFVASLLSAAALLACYVPARRAAAIDPLVALRSG